MGISYDVIVIGGGGAGLTAALYTSRADLKTILFEKNVLGGQIALTDVVDNFPGFPEGILGPDIATRMEEHAKKFGTTIQYEEVTKIIQKDEVFTVNTNGGAFSGHVIIVATGASAQMLNVPGESEFIGKGVSYCATCDAPFFRDKIVAVVGGGDSALQEGLFLTKFVRHVYIIHRRDQLRAEHILQRKAKTNEKISFIWDSVVTEIRGNGKVDTVILKNVRTNEVCEVALDGIFVFIGHHPSSKLVEGLLELDAKGYVKTNGHFQSSVPGIFVCGEVRSGCQWQLIAACGEGCQAALEVQHYIEKLKSKK